MSEYKRQTGKKHTIDKQSIITSLQWDTDPRAACKGDEAKFTVKTETVKNGANAIVTISDKSGEVNDTVEGVIQNNEFSSTYTVNENSIDYLTLKAKIADEYELEEKSNPLLVLRKIKITLIDEYKNQLDSHMTFHGLSYMIHTDTGHTYDGTVNEREITQNIHYKDEYELELLHQAAKMPDIPLEKPLAANNTQQSEDTEDEQKLASNNPDTTVQTASSPTAENSGVNSTDGTNETPDFSNYVVESHGKLNNPVTSIIKQIAKAIG